MRSTLRVPEAGRSERAPYPLLLSAALLLVLVLPMLGSALELASDRRDARKESLAKSPRFDGTLSSLRHLPGEARWYFERRFGFKDALASLHGRALVSLFGISPTRSVVLGEQGWLFLGSERVLEQYRPGHGFAPDELGAWAAAFETRRAWLAARHIPYLLVLCPNTHSVYGEKLPALHRSRTARTRTDELIARLRTHTSVDVLDLRPVLVEAARAARVFHKTDTHWNDLGAYVGSMAILDHLRKHVAPRLRLPSHSPEAVYREAAPSGDLARMMGLGPDYQEELIGPTDFPWRALDEAGRQVRPPLLDMPAPSLHILHAEQPRLGRAVIFRDSFGLATMPYLGAVFARSVYEASYGFNRERVLHERPDVVIQLLVERKLMTLRLDGFDDVTAAGH